MEKTFRKILLFSLASMLFFSSIQVSFTKSVFQNAEPFQFSLNKEKYPLTFAFYQNSLSVELAEEKKDDESPNKTVNSQYFFSPKLIGSPINFSQFDFDFLKIKSHLFRQLFLLFHCLKIPCN